MRGMRKLLAVLVVLLGCLTFIGQAAASASAGYSDCCLQGCKGMSQCAHTACQTCAAPQPAPMAGQPPARAVAEPPWPATDTPFDAGTGRGPWTPPD